MPTTQIVFKHNNIRMRAMIEYTRDSYRHMAHRQSITFFDFYELVTDSYVGSASVTLNKKCDETELEAEAREEIDMAYSAKDALSQRRSYLEDYINWNTSHISYISSDSQHEEEQDQSEDQEQNQEQAIQEEQNHMEKQEEKSEKKDGENQQFNQG